MPPSSRARVKRPVADDVGRAALLYERFTGHDAVPIGKVRVPDLPQVATVIGECDGVLYTTVRDGVTERYKHEFRQADKPLLAVTPDGRQLLLIGGEYDFTELGIVDASDRKHSPRARSRR